MIIVKDCDDLLILETEKTLPQSAFTYLKLTNTTIVSVWVANNIPAIFSVPQAVKNVTSPSWQTKRYINSDMLDMFNYNT